jgi:hypothetical protein
VATMAGSDEQQHGAAGKRPRGKPVRWCTHFGQRRGGKLTGMAPRRRSAMTEGAHRWQAIGEADDGG